MAQRRITLPPVTNGARLSKSARDLDALIKEEGRLAVDLRAVLSASNLSKYRTGKGKPGADMVALIERTSEGRVLANGWEDEGEPS